MKNLFDEIIKDLHLENIEDIDMPDDDVDVDDIRYIEELNNAI